MITRVWSNRSSHSLLAEIQNGTAIPKDSVVLSYKPHKHKFLTYDLAIRLLGIYPKELNTYVHIKTAHGCLYQFYA